MPPQHGVATQPAPISLLKPLRTPGTAHLRALAFESENLATNSNKETIIFPGFNNPMLSPSYRVHVKIESASHPFVITGSRNLPQVGMGLSILFPENYAFLILLLALLLIGHDPIPDLSPRLFQDYKWAAKVRLAH